MALKAAGIEMINTPCLPKRAWKKKDGLIWIERDGDRYRSGVIEGGKLENRGRKMKTNVR